MADRRLPFLRLLIAVALSLPAIAYALWEHDRDNLLRVGACLIWLAFGYWWGWQDRATTIASRPAENEPDPV